MVRGHLAPGELAAVGVLVGRRVHRVHDRFAAVDVVERLHRRVDRGVPEPRRDGLSARSWRSGLLQHLGQRGRLHAGARDVDVQSPLMIWLSMSSACRPSFTSIWSGSALRFGSVHASQLGLRTSLPPLLRSMCRAHVRPGRDQLRVLLARVLGLRHRHGLRQLGEVVELGERLLEVEDDRRVVRGLDGRGDVHVLRLCRDPCSPPASSAWRRSSSGR